MAQIMNNNMFISKKKIHLMTAKCYGFLNILVDTLENALYMNTQIDI